MKISLEGKQYELTDECIAGLLQLLKEPLIKSNIKLPPEIQSAIEGVNSLDGDGLTYLVQTIKDFGLGYYLGLSTPKRLGVMGFIRWVLMKLEKKVKDPEKLRPPKRTDPVEHLVGVIHADALKAVPALGKILPYVTIQAETDGSHVTSLKFTCENQSGGPLVTDGDIGLGQDHSGQTA